jgi:hypothetical protein
MSFDPSLRRPPQCRSSRYPLCHPREHRWLLWAPCDEDKHCCNRLTVQRWGWPNRRDGQLCVGDEVWSCQSLGLVPPPPPLHDGVRCTGRTGFSPGPPVPRCSKLKLMWDCTSKCCWNWCIRYVETCWWDSCLTTTREMAGDDLRRCCLQTAWFKVSMILLTT